MITIIGLIVLTIIVLLMAYNLDKQTKRIDKLQKESEYNKNLQYEMFKKAKPAKFKIGDDVSVKFSRYEIHKLDGVISNVTLTGEFDYKYEVLIKNCGKSYVLECDITMKDSTKKDDTINDYYYSDSLKESYSSLMKEINNYSFSKAMYDTLNDIEKLKAKKTKKATPKKNAKKSKK